MSLKENDTLHETIKESVAELSETGNCKKGILHANDIVSDLKKMTRVIEKYSQVNEVDFLGCSSLYCIEKICHLEVCLKYLKKNINRIDK